MRRQHLQSTIKVGESANNWFSFPVVIAKAIPLVSSRLQRKRINPPEKTNS